MVIKRGRFGEFLACSRYPECKTTKPISIGVDLPAAGLRRLPDREALAQGQGLLRLLELLEDQVRLRALGPAGPEPCPKCGAPFLVKKESKAAGVRLRCIKEGCGYSADKDDEAPSGAEPPPTDAKASEPALRVR